MEIVKNVPQLLQEKKIKNSHNFKPVNKNMKYVSVYDRNKE